MGKDKTHVNVVGESLLVLLIALAADELALTWADQSSVTSIPANRPPLVT